MRLRPGNFTLNYKHNKMHYYTKMSILVIQHYFLLIIMHAVLLFDEAEMKE